MKAVRLGKTGLEVSRIGFGGIPIQRLTEAEAVRVVQLSTVMTLRSAWKRLPAERLVTGWIAEAMESARNCIECGECEEKCPYHLPIREMIVENIEFYEDVLRTA
jgi:ferredoxin